MLLHANLSLPAVQRLHTPTTNCIHWRALYHELIYEAVFVLLVWLVVKTDGTSYNAGTDLQFEMCKYVKYVKYTF